jgi:hypothetical protein
MSFIFRDQRVGSIVFEPVFENPSPSKPSAISGPVEGIMYLDAVQKAFGKQIGGLPIFGSEVANINVTPVTGPSGTTTETAFMSFTFPSGPAWVNSNTGALNAVGKTVYIWAAGVATTSATTFTPTIKIRLGGAIGPPPTGSTVLTITPATAYTASQTNLPWELSAYITIQAGNASGGTGTIEAHGSFATALTAPTAAASTYFDQNTATVTVGDLTTSQLLLVSATLSNGTATNAMTMRQQIVQVLQ